MGRHVTKPEMLIVADLLDLAARAFSDNCCNDFDLSKHLTPDNAWDLAVREAIWNANGQEVDPDDLPPTKEAALNGYDWCLMNYFADMLRKEANA